MKLSNGVYDVFKWLGLVFFPALAVLVSVVLPVWGVDAGLVKAIVVTINAVGVFIGALIGVSQVTIAREDAAEEYFETEGDDELPIEDETDNSSEGV